mmetsp:Transcript_1605/g.5046  ORF Transcript_1605/g.5046 Transcript_1605/m.5046 type:complete len:163 (+) Transcript_1605:2024-2512(+)
MSTRQRALSAQPKTLHTFEDDDEEKEEDDDDVNANATTNNWLHLIDDRKDREKIIRLQNADDPSLRAMFEAIRVTMKKKDENMERAAMIGFERGVSFGVAEGGGGKTKTIKKKKKKKEKTVAGVAAVPLKEPKRIRRIALRISWPLETHVRFLHHLLILLPL